MSEHKKDMWTSVSAIEDAGGKDGSGGCLRRWWFDKVVKLPKAKSKATIFGDVHHAVLARFLLADDRGLDKKGLSVNLYPEGWMSMREKFGDDKTLYTITDSEASLIQTLVNKAIADGIIVREPGRIVERELGEPIYPGVVILGRVIHTDGNIHKMKIILKGFIDLETPRRIEDQYGEGTKPVIDFLGTVKLDGTHCDIVIGHDTLRFQSRNKIISTADDNIDCCVFLEPRTGHLIDTVRKRFPNFKEYIMLSGEYCSSKICKKVALRNLPKMFVLFGVCIDGVWQSKETYRDISDVSNTIYNIYDFPTWTITIDFNDPYAHQDTLDTLTKEVGTACPFAKQLGVEGVGEGIVWIPVDENIPTMWFKTKSERYVEEHKVPIVKISGDDVKPYAIAWVHPGRLEQGMDYMREMRIEPTIRTMSTFRDWVSADILREEQDVIEKNEIHVKNLMREINTLCVAWYKQSIGF